MNTDDKIVTLPVIRIERQQDDEPPMNTETDISEEALQLTRDMSLDELALAYVELRFERDAAARDMQERCAKVAETANRQGKEWLALVQTMAGSEAMRRVIVEDIRAVSLLATDSTGGAT